MEMVVVGQRIEPMSGCPQRNEISGGGGAIRGSFLRQTIPGTSNTTFSQHLAGKPILSDSQRPKTTVGHLPRPRLAILPLSPMECLSLQRQLNRAVIILENSMLKKTRVGFTSRVWEVVGCLVLHCLPSSK